MLESPYDREVEATFVGDSPLGCELADRFLTLRNPGPSPAARDGRKRRGPRGRVFQWTTITRMWKYKMKVLEVFRRSTREGMHKVEEN